MPCIQNQKEERDRETEKEIKPYQQSVTISKVGSGMGTSVIA